MRFLTKQKYSYSTICNLLCLYILFILYVLLCEHCCSRTHLMQNTAVFSIYIPTNSQFCVNRYRAEPTTNVFMTCGRICSISAANLFELPISRLCHISGGSLATKSHRTNSVLNLLHFCHKKFVVRSAGNLFTQIGYLYIKI